MGNLQQLDNSVLRFCLDDKLFYLWMQEEGCARKTADIIQNSFPRGPTIFSDELKKLGLSIQLRHLNEEA